MIFHENRLPADDSYEKAYLVYFEIGKDVAKFVVLAIFKRVEKRGAIDENHYSFQYSPCNCFSVLTTPFIIYALILCIREQGRLCLDWAGIRLATCLIHNTHIFSVKVRNGLVLLDSKSTFYTYQN